MSTLAPSLQAYFTERLIGQRAASPNTIAAYKLTFRLLLGFASKATGKAPSRLDIADLDAPLVASFLDHLVAGPADPANRRTMAPASASSAPGAAPQLAVPRRTAQPGPLPSRQRKGARQPASGPAGPSPPDAPALSAARNRTAPAHADNQPHTRPAGPPPEAHETVPILPPS
jgi:hypothetical protein